VEVTLTQGDFMTYNWVLALERPVLPFFIYSFTLLFLAGLLGLWPAARVFALAVLVPMLGYLLWVFLSARALWARYPHLRVPRTYVFEEDAYLVKAGAHTAAVPYARLRRALASRGALYLLREDGSADILPRRALPEGLEAFIVQRVGEPRRSSFL
jgi:hypothetical protein